MIQGAHLCGIDDGVFTGQAKTEIAEGIDK
jgi:hypothetical protein